MSTIREVANKARVSTATVSNVINNTKFVSKKLRNRVKKVIRESNYTPNQVARSLVTKSTNIIALLISGLNPGFLSVIEGFEDELLEHGYSLFLCNTSEDVNREQMYIDILLRRRIEGCALTTAGISIANIKTMLTNGIKLIFIDREIPGIDQDSVLLDNQKGVYAAIEHFINQGHTRIGFIAGDPHISTALERYNGYRKALQDNHLPQDELLVKWGKFSKESSYLLTKDLLKRTCISALFAANNLLALGSLKAIKERNLKIPQDIAFAMFDDMDWCTLTSPPITAIGFSGSEAGKKAAKMLLRKIASGEKSPGQKVVFSTELTIRESSLHYV